MKTKILILLYFVFALPLFCQVAVIANKSIQANSIDKNSLRKLYELGTLEFEGKKVLLFDLKTETPEKSGFYTFLGTTPGNIKKTWLKVTLSGNGVAPLSVTTQEEMLQKVASTPNSIGYISKSMVNDKVKILTEIP